MRHPVNSTFCFYFQSIVHSFFYTMESFTSAPSSEQRPYMREEEYLWSYKFSGASKEFSWCPDNPADQDDAADPSVKLGNLLLLKSMVLMPSAKAGEESVVQVESEGYNN